VLIASALSAFVLAGVLSAFVFLSRSGFRISGYGELDAEVRRGLAAFARDTRNATDVRWNGAQSVTLTVAGQAVTYAFDADPASATYRSFCRTTDSSRQILIRNVAADFAFQRFKLTQPGVGDNAAANDAETKLLQVTLRATRPSLATVGASQSAISARYMLRNKKVAN
jgi:hypothetical protein